MCLPEARHWASAYYGVYRELTTVIWRVRSPFKYLDELRDMIRELRPVQCVKLQPVEAVTSPVWTVERRWREGNIANAIAEDIAKRPPTGSAS